MAIKLNLLVLPLPSMFLLIERLFRKRRMSYYQGVKSSGITSQRTNCKKAYFMQGEHKTYSQRLGAERLKSSSDKMLVFA